MQLPDNYQQMLDQQYARLAAPGTWWNGAERVAIVATMRRAQQGELEIAQCLGEQISRFVHKVSIAAHEIDETYVKAAVLFMTPLQVVELTALVAQFSALDTFLYGAGLAARGLPQPTTGDPSELEVKGAKRMRGWFPTRGIAGAPNCFSAVADEHKALHDIHSIIYLSMEEMADLNIVKDLHRSQIELLAARTSNYNDCFY
jgi:hypothetical protein